MRRMRAYLNNLGGWAAVAILAAVPLSAARAADLKGARVWAGPEYTRVVLDVAGPLQYTISQTGGQIVVDLPDSQATAAFSDPTAQGLFRGMTHARKGAGLQLTTKVDPASRLKTFILKPISGTDYRLVLDLYPGDGSATKSVAMTKPAAMTQPAPEAVTPAVEPVVQQDVSSSVAVVEPQRRGSFSHSSRVATEQAAALLGGQRSVVVCIDAGHGGKDQGAHGPDGTLEKNVTLAVARDLAAQINRQPGMKAVLTRDGDYFIPLERRYQIARENNADLFVAIHADSYTSDDAQGSSVWVLSSRGKSSVAARMLADKENSSDLIGGVSLASENDSLASVLLDMQQGWAMQASHVVADNVLKALGQLGPTHRGYVENANFVVLRSPDVPSILVETAFISNPDEERKLRDPGHQDQLAEAIMGGVKNYFESTPPPGTWFAVQATRRNGSATELASAKSASANDGPAATMASNASSRADAAISDLHRVGPGESLRSIARQYGISVDALKSANRINADTVRAGTVLTIPTS